MPDNFIEPNDPENAVAHYFNSKVGAGAFADQYSQKASRASPWPYFYLRRQALVMQKLRSLDASSVLDVGCGPGTFAKPCAALGLHYHGVDISDRMIDEARRRSGDIDHVDFSLCDARQLPFPENNFDIVLSLGMLEYVPQDKEIKYLNEIIRVLKPGGTVLFSLLNKSSPYWLINDYVFPAFRLGLWGLKEILKTIGFKPHRDFSAKPFATRKFKLRERTELLNALGLSVIDKIYFAPAIVPPYLDKLFAPQAVLAMSKLELTPQSFLLEWLGQAFIVVAYKGNNLQPLAAAL